MPADVHAPSRAANAVLAELDDRIDRTIAPLLDGAPVALVDFPDHANVGDLAIWMGERAFFDRHRATIAYCSSLKTHAAEDLKTRLPGGTVFLHGGGNFGTIWKAHQDLRIDTLARLRDHAIVQLPQSLFFDDDFGHHRNRASDRGAWALYAVCPRRALLRIRAAAFSV